MKLETIPKGEGIKVVIGTRTYLGPDWTHIDIDPFPLYAGNDVWHEVDIVADAADIPLPDNYADIVFSSECLEHFPWKKYQDVLKEWCRILKPGGMIRIEVPDFLGTCKQLITMNSLEGDRAIQQIFFAEQMNPYDFHFVGLTSRMLVDDFEKLGFQILDVKTSDEWGLLKFDDSKPLIYEDYLLKIDAVKPKDD